MIDAHALEHRDKHIGEGVIVFCVEFEVLTMFEIAACEDDGHVGGGVFIGVAEVAAVHNERAVEHVGVLLFYFLKFIKEVPKEIHM